MTNGEKKRSIKNYILQPLLQLKFGIYFVLLSLVFVGVVIGLVYNRLNEIFQLVIELTDVPEEISAVIYNEISTVQIWVIGAGVLYFFISLLVSILLTHRMVGPTIAFKRHIQSLIDGNFEAKTFLRKRDAFTEVANLLNNLSDKLKSGR